VNRRTPNENRAGSSRGSLLAGVWFAFELTGIWTERLHLKFSALKFFQKKPSQLPVATL
jgi:hypothetical protein